MHIFESEMLNPPYKILNLSRWSAGQKANAYTNSIITQAPEKIV
jgi:hypothetical protein